MTEAAASASNLICFMVEPLFIWLGFGGRMARPSLAIAATLSRIPPILIYPKRDDVTLRIMQLLPENKGSE